LVNVGLSDTNGRLIFSKKSGGALIHDIPAEIPDEEPLAARSGSVGVPIPQAKESKAARKGQGRSEKSES